MDKLFSLLGALFGYIIWAAYFVFLLPGTFIAPDEAHKNWDQDKAIKYSFYFWTGLAGSITLLTLVTM